MGRLIDRRRANLERRGGDSEQTRGQSPAIAGGAGVLRAKHLKEIHELPSGGLVVLDPVEEGVQPGLQLAVASRAAVLTQAGRAVS